MGQVNGANVDFDTANPLRGMAVMGRIMNSLMSNTSAGQSRAELAYRTGESYGGDRDIYKSLGYKVSLTYSDYKGRYDRGDIATTIVTAFPRATWKAKPTVKEAGVRNGGFEKTWKELCATTKFWRYAERADILCGIGRYSVMLLGFADSGRFDEPVTAPATLEYLSVYGEEKAQIGDLVIDKNDPRYGMPLYYSIKRTEKDVPTKVHWSRVLHVAEGCLEDEIYGTPRLQNTFNRLQDLELIVGGSAEMFWRGAFPGFGFSADSEAELTDEAINDMNDEIEDFVHNLKRYLRLQGVDIKEFKPQVASPENHVEVQLKMIAGATRIPVRILTGSERGELASSTDESNWNSRIEERRVDFAEDIVITPFVERMIQFGVLPPTPELEIDWPDMEAVNDLTKAQVAQRISKAITDYARTPGAEVVIPPDVFLKLVIGLTEEELREIESYQEYAEWKMELAEVHEGQLNKGPAREQDYDDIEEVERRETNPRA